MLEARITALEEKFSHQDHLLDQLNKAVSDQSMLIELFKKEIMELKLSQNSQVPGTRTLKDDVPPHY